MTPKELQAVQLVMERFQRMRDSRNKTYKHFNERTLKQFVEDSQLRANSYIPDRDSQGKADWQANFFHPVTRNKLKAIIASVSRLMPDTKIVARNPRNQLDVTRADIMRELVRYSRMQENLELENFFDVWTCAVEGTLFKYEGYRKVKEKVRVVKSYDYVTGEAETEEREVITEDKCVEEVIPVLDIFLENMYEYDIQKQPSIAWCKLYDADAAKREFGKFKNFKEVKSLADMSEEERTSLYTNEWDDLVGKDQYLAMRFYSVPLDRYIILLNGTIILDTPMLWGRTKKRYPIAKTIFEPFVNKQFAYGNSLPNSLLGEQDVINALFNMAIDKTYRSLVKPLLVGTVNQDAFDLEDEVLTHDTKIPVEDVNQVREMEISGVNQSDLNMIQMMSQGLDLSSVDQVQQGVAGSGATAREIVIANEKAKELKTIFFLLLTDLWKQKTELRIMNILTYYPQAQIKEALDEEQVAEYRTMLIPNSKLSNNKDGYLSVQFVQDETKLPKPAELDAEELAYQSQGVNLEKVVITSDYLDNHEYDVSVIPESLYRSQRAERQALYQEKVQTMATMFPGFFQQNQEELFKEFIDVYGGDVNTYKLAATPPQQAMTPGQDGQPMMPPGGAPQAPNAEAMPAFMDSLAKK